MNIHRLCSKNNIDAIQLLNNDYADEILHCAIPHNSLEICKLAIQKGAIKLDNALRDACYYGYTNIAKYLIDNGGTNVNNAIYMACNVQTIQLLIDNGANDYREIMLWGCRHKNKDMIDIAINNGAQNFEHAINIACIYDDQDIIEYILNFYKGYIGNTLKYARTKHMIMFLLKKGAKNINLCNELMLVTNDLIPYMYQFDCFLFLLRKKRYDLAAVFYNHINTLNKYDARKLLNYGSNVKNQKVIRRRRKQLQTKTFTLLDKSKIKLYDKNIANFICEYIPF
jgi:hypothetical protein